MKDTIFLLVMAFFVGTFVLFAYIGNNDENYQNFDLKCESKNGKVLVTHSRRVCIKKDAFIDMNKE
jgi:hypothetical protein